jgi:hypothetical protein
VSKYDFVYIMSIHYYCSAAIPGFRLGFVETHGCNLRYCNKCWVGHLMTCMHLKPQWPETIRCATKGSVGIRRPNHVYVCDCNIRMVHVASAH